MLAEMTEKPEAKPFPYPLNLILNKAIAQEVVKDYPLQLLDALTMGQLTFILKHTAQGLLELNDELISCVVKSCWDSIRR